MECRSLRWPTAMAVGSVLLLVILAALPSCGWLVRSQMAWLFRPAPAFTWLWGELDAPSMVSLDVARERARIQQFARRNPGDLQVQVAASEFTHADLAPLLDRFPNSPFLCAQILKRMTWGDIRTRPQDEERLRQIAFGKDPSYTEKPTQGPRPEVASAYQRYAARGERLDPDNAFFPMMAAQGCLAVDDLDATFRDMHRAAGKPRWDDYSAEMTRSQWHLQQRLYMDRNALVRIGLTDALLEPHLVSARSVARVEHYRAVALEKAGYPDAGISLRHDVIRVGSLMRNQSPTFDGSLTGAEMLSIAAAGPAGQDISHTLKDEDRPVARAKLYADWLRHSGHSQEATWAAEQLDPATRDLQLNTTLRQLAPVPVGSVKMIRLLHSQVIGMLCLSSGVLLLLLGLVGVVFYKTGWRSRRGLITAILGITIGWASLLWLSHWDVTMSYLVLIIQSLTGDQDFPMSAFRWTEIPGFVQIAAVALCLACPIFAAGMSLGIGSVRRRASFLCIRDGLIMIGLPLALVLLLGYARVTVSAISLSNQTNRELERCIPNERAYCTELIHQTEHREW